MATTTRLIILAIAVCGLAAVCWPLAGMGAPAPPLLSQHSQPAVRLPEKMVAIVEDGKLFHDPKCTMKHGKPRLMTAEQAAQMGYSPCTRCMRKALQRP